MSAKPLLVVLGATASGKTKLAVALAQALHGEIISADSRQIFRGMSIGTGKDLNEYTIGETQIPYHLIDIREAGDKYNVNEFKEDFYQAFDKISASQQLPILCGGTGMYIHSLLQNQEFTSVPKDLSLREKLYILDKSELIDQLNSFPKNLTAHADISSTKRIIRAIEVAEYLMHHQLEIKPRTPIAPLVIGLESSIETRRSRILARLDQRLNDGLIAEVEMLLNKGVDKDTLVFYGLEYKFVTAYLNGEMNFETLRERLGIAICQFAKRQMTFFRKMEKDGVKIHWLNAEQDFSALTLRSVELVRLLDY